MARELLQTAAAIRSCGARAALVALAVGLSGGPLSAQASASDPSAGHSVAEHDGAVPQRAEAPLSEGAARLPAATETRHEILIDGQPLRFAATAGALALAASDGKLEAELAYIAYTLEGGDAAERPVTFVVNGGPGAASAYLQLGALGPWAVALGPDRIRPSDAPSLADNPDTWLAFTDLVFIDPVGAGFSRLASGDDRVRERYLSVEGDIEALAQAILRWTLENGRLGSSRYFVGESYGGFRGPLLAEELLTGHGLALSGLVLVSPVLDFGWWEQPSHAPLPRASLLPSLAASALEAGGAFSEAALAEAEAYAGGPYVADLLRGVGDRAAVDRLVDRVTDLTGLDRATVAAANGRIDMQAFARGLARADQRVLSLYDGAYAAPDPFPETAQRRGPEPLLDALTAPLTSAMLALHSERLGWLPEGRYQLINDGVNRSWNWGDGRGQPEAVSALRRVLALDPAHRVLVVHGYTDLVTPYFASELILRQVDDPEDRVRLATYRGGHMFYTEPRSRAAFRRDAEALIGTPNG